MGVDETELYLHRQLADDVADSTHRRTLARRPDRLLVYGVSVRLAAAHADDLAVVPGVGPTLRIGSARANEGVVTLTISGFSFSIISR